MTDEHHIEMQEDEIAHLTARIAELEAELAGVKQTMLAAKVTLASAIVLAPNEQHTSTLYRQTRKVHDALQSALENPQEPPHAD